MRVDLTKTSHVVACLPPSLAVIERHKAGNIQCCVRIAGKERAGSIEDPE